MTQEDLKILSRNPKEFLSRCKWNEQRIKIRREQIQKYRDMALSITASIKDVPSFGGVPSSKIENCAVNIAELESGIEEEIKKLKDEIGIIKEAINLTKDNDLKFLLEARYLQRMNWEEIAVLLSRSYRWTLRLHGKALQEISREASLLLEPTPLCRKED